MKRLTLRNQMKAMTKKKAALPDTLRTRQLRCWDYFVTGMSYRDIAAQQDINVSHTQVATDIRGFVEELRQLDLQKVDQRRQLQIERSNIALKALWPKILKGDIDAINTMYKGMKHEAELLGLNAPTKVDIRMRLEEMALAEGWDVDETIMEASYVVEEAS